MKKLCNMQKTLIILTCLIHAALATDIYDKLRAERPHNSLHENSQKYDHDVDLSPPKIIRRHGYPAESHEVQTEDGYLLKLHRIPARSRPVVFLQHGLFDCSVDWIVTGPGKALAYILWDSGYDVWIGNSRGNTYSRSHVSLSPTDSKYWDFSFHEMGVYDLPAVIDYMLNVTGQPDLFYVGHSMGTTMFYVMASIKTEYNAKVKAMISLAPVAFLEHNKSPLSRLAPFVSIIEFTAQLLGIGEVAAQSTLTKLFAKYVCEPYTIEAKICEIPLMVVSGFDAQQFNESLLPVIVGHTPAGTSSKNLIHYLQELNSGKFRQYDYHSKGNQAAYGQPTPPDYNLTRITTPVSLHVAENDWLADPEDVSLLAVQLQNKIGTFVVPYPPFSHNDFVCGTDANTLVYAKVIEVLQQLGNP